MSNNFHINTTTAGTACGAPLVTGKSRIVAPRADEGYDSRALLASVGNAPSFGRNFAEVVSVVALPSDLRGRFGKRNAS